MTRKDYIALAAALRVARPPYPDGEVITSTEAAAQLTWERTCREIGNVCQADNPRFDRTRFVQACLGPKTQQEVSYSVGQEAKGR